MPAGHIIPSIYTAVDKVSGPVRAMSRNVGAFANKANKAVNSIIPSIGGLGRELLALAGISSTLAFGAFNIGIVKDYEAALASFRVIVGGTDAEFSKYEKTVGDVAKATGKSTIDVANAFENVAGLNAKFAETTESISAVTTAAITLSKASRDDLGNSAANLVGIMNQFNLSANQADRTINVLAAGQAVGASSITQTAESFKNFGSVASGANISLEESVALIQTLGKFSVFGAESGTKLRGSILKLQQAGVGYASGQFNINDALAEAKKNIDALKSPKQQDLALQKMFGAENISTGRILLSNIEIYKDFAKSVTNTSEAQKAAKINSSTLTVALEELKAKWINIVTTSDKAGSSLSILKTAIVFVTENMESLVTILSVGIITLIAFKTIMAVVTAVQAGWATVQAVSLALQGKTLLFLQGNTVALFAYKAIMAGVTAAQWLWNAATIAGGVAMQVLMSPITWMLAALGALIFLVYKFYQNWEMITSAFKDGGIVAGIKAIGVTLLDAVLQPLLLILQLASKLPGVGNIAAGAAQSIQNFRQDIGAVNPSLDKQESLNRSIEEKNQNVSIDINDKTGRAKVKSDNNFVPIRTTSTFSPA